MNVASQSYVTWLNKHIKNLGYTKGFEAKNLLRRFDQLQMPETDLSCVQHVRTLQKIHENYAQEKTGLRWLDKSCVTLGTWRNVLEATVQQTSDLTEDVLLNEFVAGRLLSVDEAVDLMQVIHAD